MIAPLIATAIVAALAVIAPVIAAAISLSLAVLGLAVDRRDRRRFARSRPAPLPRAIAIARRR